MGLFKKALNVVKKVVNVVGKLIISSSPIGFISGVITDQLINKLLVR